MSSHVAIRSAQKTDLTSLVTIEDACFTSDKLSRRSFLRFIQTGAHRLLVAHIDDQIVGYVLVLYRDGTSLARLYSIAISPDHQGRGFARLLVESAESAAREKRCAFMRLEVNVCNETAIRLYQKMNYKPMGTIRSYYDDGSDALRMEKRIYGGVPRDKASSPYYEQTTDFSCGPAALMMAMKNLNSDYEMNRTEELKIWREATTIFMTSGHGGCSPYGLALSAWQRGFQVKLYINQEGAPFVDGVRDIDKKAVIELVHKDFLSRMSDTNIELYVQDISPDELQALLRAGHAMIALISTWRLNRNKAPHWVFVVGIDENFVYINDPDISDNTLLSETDYVQVPITIEEFVNMACFGQRRLRCLLSLSQK